MKLTKQQLKRIIKEELSRVLKEMPSTEPPAEEVDEKYFGDNDEFLASADPDGKHVDFFTQLEDGYYEHYSRYFDKSVDEVIKIVTKRLEDGWRPDQ